MAKADHIRQLEAEKLQKQAHKPFQLIYKIPRTYPVCSGFFIVILQIMKRLLLFIALQAITVATFAQCAICTKTASQMGEDAGKGFNFGVIYLAAMPFAIIGYIAFRWWKSDKQG